MAEMNLSTAELLQQMIDIKKDMRTAIGDKGVTVVSGMESYPSAIDNIPQEVYVGNSKLTDGILLRGTFTECPMFDTSEMTTMKEMFYGCKSLTTVPLLDTSNVTNMRAMFQACYALTSVGQFDTSNVTNMVLMFEGCTSLTSVPQFDTSKVTTMDSMFRYCRALTSVPQFDTSSVANMYYMFADCPSLTTIPLLDASNATDVQYMFSGCKALTNIGGLKNLGKTQVSVNLGLYNSPKITNESWTNIFNNLWDRSSGYDNYSSYIEISISMIRNIPDEIKAIATSKGWALVSS